MDDSPIGEPEEFDHFYERTRHKIEPEKAPKFLLEPLRNIKPMLNGAYLIKGLLQSTGLAVLFGPPGSCKSFVAISAALHVAAGREWAGRKVKQTGVVYCASEGSTGFRKRVYAAARHFGFPLDTPFGLITVAPNLGAAEGDTPTLIREVREQAAMFGFRPGLIVLDTLARSIVGADENSPKDMGFFVENADVISRSLKACVLAIHHTGKNTDKGMRGSSALHGAAETEWEIIAGDDGKSIRLAKQKDGEGGFSVSFSTTSIEVGADDEGEPVTTLVADVSGTSQHSQNVARERPKLKGQRAEFIKAVTIAIEEIGEQVPASEHVPNGIKGVRRQSVTRYAEQLGFVQNMTPKVRDATIGRHIVNLAGDNFLGQWGPWIWLR